MSGRFSLIGPGRAGLSLAGALTTLDWEQVAIYRRGDDVREASTGVDICVIATPDSAISEVAARVKRTDAVMMHVSGATPLSELGQHRAAGLHPLVSLADPETGAHALRTAWFAVAGDPVARDLAQSLSGKWFTVDDSDRALYHGAAAIASNHLVGLLGQVERLAIEIGVPFEAFIDLVRSSVENTAVMGPAAALTGPVVRGDERTIEMHRAAIAERMPEELAAYDALLVECRRLVDPPAAD